VTCLNGLTEIPSGHCTYLLSSEPTAIGTGIALIFSAGKEDPVELDSSLILCCDMKGVA